MAVAAVAAVAARANSRRLARLARLASRQADAGQNRERQSSVASRGERTGRRDESELPGVVCSVQCVGSPRSAQQTSQHGHAPTARIMWDLMRGVWHRGIHSAVHLYGEIMLQFWATTFYYNFFSL